MTHPNQRRMIIQRRLKSWIRNGLLQNIQTFLFANLYYLTLHIIFKIDTSVIHFYAGFFNNFSIYNFLVSYFMFFLLLMLNLRLVLTPKKVSEYVMLLLFFLAYSPTNVLFSFGILDISYFFYAQIYWLCLSIIIWWYSFYQMKLPVINDIIKKRMSLCVLVISCSIVVYVFIKYAKFVFMLDFIEVYSLRLSARQYPMSKVLIYLFGFARAAIPLFLGYSVLNNRWKTSLFLIIIQFCNFSVDGSKDVYFITILVLIVAIVYNPFINRIIAMLMFFGVATSQLLSQLGFNLINNVIIRRVLFLPQQISYCYYDYTLSNAPNYFNNLLRFIGLNNYKPNIPFLIGEMYFNSPITSANNGLVGDAFWNLGVYGIIVFPLLIGVLLFCVDTILKEHSQKIRLITAIVIASGLQDSSLTTLLLTHGLLVQLAVLFFLPNTNLSEGNTKT